MFLASFQLFEPQIKFPFWSVSAFCWNDSIGSCVAVIWRLGIAWPTPQPRRQVNGTKCAPHFDTGLEAPRLHSFLHQLICPKPVFAACLAPSAASARWIWSFLPRHPGCSENTTSNFMTSGTAGCQHQRCRCVKSYLFCSLIFLWRKPSIYKVHLFSHSLDPNTHTKLIKSRYLAGPVWLAVVDVKCFKLTLNHCVPHIRPCMQGTLAQRCAIRKSIMCGHHFFVSDGAQSYPAWESRSKGFETQHSEGWTYAFCALIGYEISSIPFQSYIPITNVQSI